MDQAKELFGLLLILAFIALLPGFVKTCPSCPGANLPTKLVTTSVTLFSGTIDTVDNKSATIEGDQGVLTIYGVSADKTWLGWGKQSADLQLSRLNSERGCLISDGNEVQGGIFFVVGPPHDMPFFWVCL